MRKVLFLLVISMCMYTLAYGAAEGTIEQVFDNVAVSTNTTVVATSKIIPVKSSGYFGVWYKFSNSTQGVAAIANPNVKIVCEESYNDNVLNFVTPTNMSDVVASETTLATKVTTISPAPMKYLRFKCIPSADADSTTTYGVNGNTTGTTITMYLFRQE